MSKEKEPQFYENILNKEDVLGQDDIENYLAEVSTVLIGIEKGLEVMKKIGKKPDSMVLDNQVRFDKIKGRLLSLIE
jgi:hypothetical protein